MSGSVVRAGIGPGDDDLVTPQVTDALVKATDIVGYFPYVDRIAPRDGLTRHGSDNRVEIDRSQHALEMALEGKHVVVVSSGDPGVFAMAAAVFEALENGHFDGLEPWEQTFFVIAISHCEGPEHSARMRQLKPVIEGIVDRLPDPIKHMGDGFKAQHERVSGIIANFGRHPHRNEVLGRPSTPSEDAYIATGDFPHVRKASQVMQTEG